MHEVIFMHMPNSCTYLKKYLPCCVLSKVFILNDEVKQLFSWTELRQ